MVLRRPKAHRLIHIELVLDMCDQRYGTICTVYDGTAANETLANTLRLAAVCFLSKYREGLFKFAQVQR